MTVAAEADAGFIVGAYASSPTAGRWDPAPESEYLEELAGVAGILGLELPWLGSLHPHDEPWLLANLPPRWQVVLTSVGYTVAAVARDPTHGLASDHVDGRRAAVASVAEMRAGVRRLNDSAGTAVVTAVELQAGPGRAPGRHSARAEPLRPPSPRRRSRPGARQGVPPARGRDRRHQGLRRTGRDRPELGPVGH